MLHKKQDKFPFKFGGLPKDRLFFTSDTHFSHKNIIKYTDRPFNNVKEMDEILINRWNEKVGENDLVFHLGDFALGKEADCQRILERLNGHKVLIKGNHEKCVMSKSYNRELFDGGIYELLEIKINDEEVSNEFQDITLCHYTMKTWNKSHRGSLQLFGHVHAQLNDSELLKPTQMDVGVDSAYKILGEYRPFSYYEVKEYLKTKME